MQHGAMSGSIAFVANEHDRKLEWIREGSLRVSETERHGKRSYVGIAMVWVDAWMPREVFINGH